MQISDDDPDTPVETLGYINERGHRVIELEKDGDGLLRVRGRLFAAGVDQLLAVDDVSFFADWQPYNPRTTWVLTDQQGTVRDLIEYQGPGQYTHEHITYDSFGVPTNLSGLASSVRTYYAGREYDFYTDLYNNRARWYDAAMQRFISEDPIGYNAGDPNLYRYCGNSPINATDPSGMMGIGDSILNFANDGENIYGFIPTDSWIGGFYESSGSALGNAAPEFFAEANAWTLIGGTAAFATGVVLTGGALGYAAGAAGLTGSAAFMLGAGGSAAGLYGGLLQTYAANPNASFGEYAFGGGLGAIFGGFCPGGSFGTLGGTLFGAGVGGSRGAQWGGLVGGIAGGGWQYGWRAAAWETGGALVGAGAGYAYYGDAQGALFGANIGMFAGGIAQGIAGRAGAMYRGRAGADLGAPNGGLSRGAQLRQKYAGSFDEYARFRAQGHSPEGARRLAQSYTGVGHHFIQQAPINRAINRVGADSLLGRVLSWYRDSALNVVSGRNMNTGRFYEYHARIHGLPAFGPRTAQGMRLLPGEPWRAADVVPALQPYGRLGYIWHGSPTALKATAGGTVIVAGAGVWGVYEYFDE